MGARANRIMAAGLLAAALGACVSVPGGAPSWYAARAAEQQDDYPRLQDVPRHSEANTDAAYWQALEAELIAAREQMRANPRAQPAGAEEDAEAFLNAAREQLDSTRRAHPQ